MKTCVYRVNLTTAEIYHVYSKQAVRIIHTLTCLHPTILGLDNNEPKLMNPVQYCGSSCYWMDYFRLRISVRHSDISRGKKYMKQRKTSPSIDAGIHAHFKGNTLF